MPARSPSPLLARAKSGNHRQRKRHDSTNENPTYRESRSFVASDFYGIHTAAKDSEPASRATRILEIGHSGDRIRGYPDGVPGFPLAIVPDLPLLPGRRVSGQRLTQAPPTTTPNSRKNDKT